MNSKAGFEWLPIGGGKWVRKGEARPNRSGGPMSNRVVEIGAESLRGMVPDFLCKDAARAVLTALEAEGYKIIAKLPTVKMTNAGLFDDNLEWGWKQAWKAARLWGKR